ncbi:MAG: rhomboid family intramembrane serine protease [Alphaproteobacteria bacterium]
MSQPPVHPSAPPPSARVPAFNTTRWTLILIAVNVAIHAGRSFGLSDGADSDVVFDFGFIPALFVVPGGWPVWPGDAMIWLTPLSYAFLHGDWVHLGINMLFLLAFGTPVERRLGSLRFLAFYLTCAVFAAVASTLSYWITDGIVLIVGASGAISGLFGGSIRFARFRLRSSNPDAPGRLVGPWLLVLSFVLVNIAFGFTGFGSFGEVRAIAWEAHLGGFFAGLLLFALFEKNASGPASGGPT